MTLIKKRPVGFALGGASAGYSETLPCCATFCNPVLD